MIKLQISKFIIVVARCFFSIFNIFSYSESIDKQVSDISNELLCPVCRGQTVAESNSDLANDFRDIIKTKLKTYKLCLKIMFNQFYKKFYRVEVTNATKTCQNFLRN